MLALYFYPYEKHNYISYLYLIYYTSSEKNPAQGNLFDEAEAVETLEALQDQLSEKKTISPKIKPTRQRGFPPQS